MHQTQPRWVPRHHITFNLELILNQLQSAVASTHKNIMFEKMVVSMGRGIGQKRLQQPKSTPDLQSEVYVILCVLGTPNFGKRVTVETNKNKSQNYRH